MTARTGCRVAAATVAVVSLAGCDDAAQVPTTVVVNTPPADGGQLVLVTVMIAVAFVVAAAGVVCAWGWASERRARREAEAARRQAEDVVLALTGQPIAQVRPTLFTGRFANGADPAWPPARGELGSRRPGGQVAGWSE